MDTRGEARLRLAGLVAAVASLVPYTALKLLWLSGSTVGMRPGQTGHMQDGRMEIGNVVTLALAVVAVIFAVAITVDRAHRMPWWLVLLPAAGAAGALAPIVLGLPLGVGVQLLVTGDARSGGEGDLEGWVFAVVYGGFTVLGLALAVLFALYVRRRWGGLLARRPRAPQRAIAVFAVIGMGSFAAVMGAFGATGGLAGWQSIAQRTVLVVTAVLAVLGLAAPLLGRRERPRALAAWLLGWIGCCVAAVQGPTLLLLAHDAVAPPVVVAVAVVATPAAALYGLAAMRDAAARSRVQAHR